jgi:hypothetical protein
MATIRPSAMVKPNTTRGRPPGAHTAPAAPSTRAGRARAARPALVDGLPGAVWAKGGQPRVVFGFTVRDGLIVEIDLLADPEHLARMDLSVTPNLE